MDLTFVNLGENPELTAAMWTVHGTWPEFMLHDPLADLYYPRLAATFPEHQILGVAGDGKVVARINSVPFRWTGSDEDLPDRGWDAAIEAAFGDAGAGGIPAVLVGSARGRPAGKPPLPETGHDLLLEAERAHRAPRRIRWPLRDRETDTRINRVEAGHASNIELCVTPLVRHAAPPAPLAGSVKPG